MNKPSAAMVAQYVIKDGLKELVLLPVWWYTTGLGQMFAWLTRSIKGVVRFFGLDIWVKNLFVPMYGEESITGRLISFGVRLFMVIARSVVVLLSWVAFLVLALLYVLILPLLFIGFLGNFFGLL